MSRIRLPGLAVTPVVAALLVAAATLVIAVVETFPGVPNASSVYLVAVAGTAILAGTRGAVFAAVLSVLVYDFLFVNPRHTLTIADPGEWLNLVLLLFVAVTVGQLAAVQRRRAQVAIAREREARALVHVTRALATRESAAAVLPSIGAALAAEAAMDRVTFVLESDQASPSQAADRAALGFRPGTYAVLHRSPGDEPPSWTIVHEPASASQARRAGERHFRVPLEAGGRMLGALWCTRSRASGEPDASATRLLAAAADQVAQAIAHDQLLDEAQRAEIARQSDALKSALLESVSHDLRTPLASIRAYAGTLMDPDVELASDEARASATAIDREAQRLNRLVANLLDLSRIEGGALRAAREPLDVEDVVGRVVAQVEPRAERRLLEVDIAEPVTVSGDPVLLEQALLNLLENAVGHTPDGTRVRIGARPVQDDTVRITVEDTGPGVALDALPRLFEKFSRPSGRRGSARATTGIGLAVARGLVEAMHGHASARPSELGGLAIDLDLPAAPRAAVHAVPPG